MAKKVNLDDDDFEKDLEAEDVVEEVESVDEAVVVEEAAKPRAKNTGLTLALCALNVLAALGFTFLLILDYQKRQEWSFAAFMNELYIEGLPLKQEDDGPSASRVTMAKQKLDAKQISEVFRMRGGSGGGEFWAVDEAFPERIRAKDLTPAILKDYFGSQGAPVITLEAEVQRLKTKVPGDIAQVAGEAADAFKGKDDNAKRQFASKLLLPLAYNIFQVEKLDGKLKAAKGAALDALLADAIERRMLVEILAPCEIYRPGAYRSDKSFTFLIEKVGDLDYLKLDDLKGILDKRFDVAIADKFDGSVHFDADWDVEKRDSVEKRETIGFLLVAIANVQKPDAAKPGQYVPLYPDAGAPQGTPNLLRAQTVLGLYQFAAAAQNLPVTWRIMEQQLIKSIQIDRQGFDIVFNNKSGKFKELEGKLTRNEAFIDKHWLAIKRIQDLTVEIKKADDRLIDLQDQNTKVKKIFGDRAEHLNVMTKKLIAARVETAKQVAELHSLQAELYQAQVELRDAADRNDRLLKNIEAQERSARSQKGAKTP